MAEKEEQIPTDLIPAAYAWRQFGMRSYSTLRAWMRRGPDQGGVSKWKRAGRTYVSASEMARKLQFHRVAPHVSNPPEVLPAQEGEHNAPDATTIADYAP